MCAAVAVPSELLASLSPPPPGPAVAFALRLAEALHRYGTPAHRLEGLMQRVSERLGLEGRFFSTPTSLFSSFGPPEALRTSLIRVDPGDLHLERLTLLDVLADDVIQGRLTPEEGARKVEAILALPPGAVAGFYKATEQGEALDHKYARPELARRTLELILGGVLLHTLDAQPRPPPEDERTFRAVFDTLAETGRREYRALVWEDPRFLELFTSATPVEEIASLPIGSRPSKRKAGGLETLRAIPWVFAWTQNRAILPGWYGVGSALEAYAREEGGVATLKRMYREWPFFRAVIDNVTMVLAKSDMAIAGRYAKLASDATRPVWRRIQQEHRRTRKQVKRLTGELKLLDHNPQLQRSISLRNPYVDPMSFLQVELLQRKREGQPDVDRPLLLTLNGIAAGMRNTG
ncbi:phosphoenolpyruvate carboxylase [Pyxidicoccus sp. 3LG]